MNLIGYPICLICILSNHLSPDQMFQLKIYAIFTEWSFFDLMFYIQCDMFWMIVKNFMRNPPERFFSVNCKLFLNVNLNLLFKSIIINYKIIIYFCLFYFLSKLLICIYIEFRKNRYFDISLNDFVTLKLRRRSTFVINIRVQKLIWKWSQWKQLFLFQNYLKAFQFY